VAHWAELDESNLVLRVTVGDNNEPDEGYGWLIANLGGRWLKTSYNASIRRKFAGVGDYYDEALDGFVPPQPYPSWVFDDTAWFWVAPVAYPADGGVYDWDETSQEWMAV